MSQKVYHKHFSVVYTMKLSWNTHFMKETERNISQCILAFILFYHNPYFPKTLFSNCTSPWVFSCKFAAYFQNTFSPEHLWTAATVLMLLFNQEQQFRDCVMYRRCGNFKISTQESSIIIINFQNTNQELLVTRASRRITIFLEETA